MILPFAILAFIVTPWAMAQIGPCTGTPLPNLGGFIGVEPGSPTSGDTVTISVGLTTYDPVSVVADVTGNVINVTLSANLIPVGVPPPAKCGTALVGPLSSGTYTINLYLIALTAPGSGPVLRSSASLAVTPADAFAPIPTNTSMGLVLLALFLGAVAWYYLRFTPRGR